MYIPSWLPQIRRPVSASEPIVDRPRSLSSGVSARRRVRPCLEPLEDRVTPAAVAPAMPAAPPSLPQALFSLSLDGAALQLANLQFEFVDNIDEFGIVPSVTTDAQAKAAAAGINFDAVMSLTVALGNLTGRSFLTAGADIDFNLPSAGPLGLFALHAGSQAAVQAVQLQPSSS
jgi:hypothetical protein